MNWYKTAKQTMKIFKQKLYTDLLEMEKNMAFKPFSGTREEKNKIIESALQNPDCIYSQRIMPKLNWYKLAKAKPSEEELDKQLKDFIKTSPFFQKLFAKFRVPLDRMDSNLKFKIESLDGKNAISDSDTITFNEKLFDQYDFLTDGIHFVAHEISHWLQRQREDSCYLSDPEEIESFSTGIAYELSRGRNEGDIRAIYYPILLDHVQSEHDAEKMFKALVLDAVKRLKELNNELV